MTIGRAEAAAVHVAASVLVGSGADEAPQFAVVECPVGDQFLHRGHRDALRAQPLEAVNEGLEAEALHGAAS